MKNGAKVKWLFCFVPLMSKSHSDVHGVKEECHVACLIISIRSIKLHQNKHTLYFMTLSSAVIIGLLDTDGLFRLFLLFLFLADPHYRNMTWCALTSSEGFQQLASCKSMKRIRRADYTLYGGWCNDRPSNWDNGIMISLPIKAI